MVGERLIQGYFISLNKIVGKSNPSQFVEFEKFHGVENFWGARTIIVLEHFVFYEIPPRVHVKI